MWFLQHNPTGSNRLNTDEWIKIYDIIDVLGVYKDITIQLQARKEPTIVYLLPQLLRVNVKYLVNPYK